MIMKKLLLFIPLLLIPILATKPASAVSDYNVTINESSTVNSLICSNDSSDNVPACSDYSYLKIESNVSFGSKTIQFRTSTSTFSVFTDITAGFTSQVLTLGSDVYKVRSGGGLNLPSTYTITLTFSENPFSSCPDPEPCPICSDSSAFIQVIIDAFWKYHVAFAGSIAGILAVFFIFRFIKSRIK